MLPPQQVPRTSHTLSSYLHTAVFSTRFTPTVTWRSVLVLREPPNCSWALSAHRVAAITHILGMRIRRHRIYMHAISGTPRKKGWRLSLTLASVLLRNNRSPRRTFRGTPRKHGSFGRRFGKRKVLSCVQSFFDLCSHTMRQSVALTP